jgi:hypothetical protein
VIDRVTSFATPNAASLSLAGGVDVSARVNGIPIGLGFFGFAEGIWSLRNGGAAFYVGGGGGIGLAGSKTASASVSAEFALYLGLESSDDFIAPEVNISLPFKSILTEVRNNVKRELFEVLARPNQLVGPAVGIWDYAKIARYNRNVVRQAVDKINGVSSFANDLSATISFGLGSSYTGIAIGYDLIDTSGSLAVARVGISVSERVFPEQRIAF